MELNSRLREQKELKISEFNFAIVSVPARLTAGERLTSSERRVSFWSHFSRISWNFWQLSCDGRMADGWSLGGVNDGDLFGFPQVWFCRR